MRAAIVVPIRAASTSLADPPYRSLSKGFRPLAQDTEMIDICAKALGGHFKINMPRIAPARLLPNTKLQPGVDAKQQNATELPPVASWNATGSTCRHLTA